MGKEVTTISPEGLEIANCYLQYGNIRAVCEYMGVPENQVVELLNKREVKKYIDTVYLDMGYRNKNNIATVLDEMIASKLEEAQETGVYSSKDLADLLQMAKKCVWMKLKRKLSYLKPKQLIFVIKQMFRLTMQHYLLVKATMVNSWRN